jgi:hypothetical protein
MLLAERLQLCDPSAFFFSLVAELTDILHGLVDLLIWGMSQLHLVQQTSHMVATSGRQHHSTDFFMGSADIPHGCDLRQAILGMLQLVVLLVA